MDKSILKRAKKYSIIKHIDIIFWEFQVLAIVDEMYQIQNIHNGKIEYIDAHTLTHDYYYIYDRSHLVFQD